MHSFDIWLREELDIARKVFASTNTFTGNDCPEYARVRQLEEVWRVWEGSTEYYLSQDITHEDDTEAT